MSINFNTDPYYDDYDEAKDFYRILFRPGVAVQARELTQLQTILQKQVSRFGDHMFKNGSQVIPGSVNVDNKVHFAKLEDTYNTTEVTTYLTSFSKKIITGVTSGVTAVVVDSSECDCVIDGTVPTLYFKYESTGADGEIKRFLPGEDLIAYAADNTTANNYRLTENQIGDLGVTVQSPVGATTYTNNPNTDVLGYGYGVEVKEGIYFINGTFVRNDELHLYIGRFDPFPTARVGFKVVESIVTPEEDTTLLDPAQGAYNYTAPGAHRYKISLELVELPETSSGSDSIQFVELARIREGVLQHKVKQSEYAHIERELAKRTYDAEGHFETNKFRVSKREHLNDGTNQGVYTAAEGGDANKIAIVIDPGRAYVLGYEVESIVSNVLTADKARTDAHVVQVSDYPINTPIGNYVVIDNVRGGIPSLSTFETVDLLNTYTFGGADHTGGSSAEKVGTARVRAFELYSSNYSSGDDTQFKLGLFNIKMNAGKSFEKDVKSIVRQAAQGVTTGGANIVPAAKGFVTGSATNDPLDSGSGTGNVVGSGTLFQDEFLIGDVVIINGQIAGQVATISSQTEMTISDFTTTVLDGRIQNFRAEIAESEYNEMMFRLGYSNIKSLRDANGNLNGTLFVRRIINETTDTSGNWTHTLTNTNETLLSDQDLSNYTIVLTSNGTIQNINSSNITFNAIGARKTVTISGLSPSTQYSLLTTIKQEDGIIASERSKTLVEDFAQTFTGKKTVTANTIELNKADVLRLKDIRVTPGDYDAYDANNSVSILDSYNLDNGQRPTFYKNGAIILKGNKNVPSGAIRVVYDYFSHGSTGNYFSVDSYIRPETPASGIDYEDIPVAELANGKKVSLADVVDFRPIISGTNTVFNELPKMGTDMTSSYSYYLARRDKITVNSEGKFRVIQGIPSLDPKLPAHPIEEMLLGDILVPPYTLTVNDVTLTPATNRRYKAKDIGQLEQRIRNVEKAVGLDQLSKDAADLQLIDGTTGLPRFKNGFITDDASGHSIGNVRDPDYRIAIDPISREMRPMHFTSALDILEDISSQAEREAAGYRREGDLLSLSYTEVPVIQNPYASRSIDVNPYKIGAFKGEIILNPEGDNWKDTDRRPDLMVNDDNGYDAIKYIADELGITGTQWNEWETNWSSTTTSGDGGRRIISGDPNRRRQWVTVEEGGVTTETVTQQSRTGLATNLSTTVNTQDYGDRIVDMSYIPYMRARPVLVLAKNLKSDTKFWPFFDSIPVDSYVKPADVFTVSLNTPSATFMDFDPTRLVQGIVADRYERLENGRVQPAYQIGDVLRNAEHTATNITAITNLTIAGTSFDLTVASTSNLAVGHHVMLYNLAANRAIAASPAGDNINIPESTINNYALSTSSELNLKKFKITAISGTTVTLENIDGSDISAFSAYNTAAYTSGDGGKLLRLRASGVVAYAGTIGAGTTAVPTTQDIHLVNIKNGFAVGEVLTGVITTSGGTVNNVVVDAINGNTSTTTVSTMKTTSDDLRTDIDGSVVGTFYLPNNDTLAFRTGERTFKLIDNRTNNDADFDSKGTAVYYSTGMQLSKERTVVNSRDVRFVEDRLYEEITTRRVTTTPRRTYTYYTGHDPVAQTFTVSSPGGIQVTSADLYFQEAGNRPVTVELRVTNNGIPSSKIIPFSQVTLQPSQLNTSDDGSVATKFTFQAPIYLQNTETYALVVKTDEPGCRFFISEVGQTDIATGNIITSQPLTGALYLSQNSIEFEINPLYDMKFTLRQAEFSTAPVVIDLKTAPPPSIDLLENPFTMATGTNKVRVRARNHGFKANDLVVISNVAEGVYGADGVNGIPHTLLNGTHTVTSTGLDKDSFIIEVDTVDGNSQSLIIGTLSNLINGEYGGTGITMTRQLDMDLMYLKSGQVIVPDTDINFTFIAENAGGSYTDEIAIVADSTYEFAERKLIKSYENQQIVQASPLVKRSSLRFKATLSTTNKFVSPVLDLQKLNAYIVSNLVNDAQAGNINVEELDAITLLETGLVTSSDVTVNGTGSITSGTGTTAVTGVSTLFTTEVEAGDVLYDGSDNLIGTVESVTDDTNIVLTANAAIAVSSAAFKIQRLRHVKFENVNGQGTITTSVDTADNLLVNAEVGKWLKINNFGDTLDGSYQVESVESLASDDTIANSEGDAVVITLSTAFPLDRTQWLDLVNDELNYDGTGTIVAATTGTTVTGTGTLFELEAKAGQKIIMPDGTELGTIASITSDTELELLANAAIDVTAPGDTYAFQEETSTYEIKSLQKFVEDFAPTGVYNYANYSTRPLLLETPGDSFKVIFDASIPVNTDLKVYYRVSSGSDEISEQIWENTNFINTTTNADGEFTEREITIEDLTIFSKLQIKIAFKSTNEIFVPKVKNLKLVAYS